MKSLFAFVLALVVSLPALAAPSFNVVVQNTNRSNEVSIRFSTIQTHSSMCFFKSTIEEVVAPKDGEAGRIVITAADDPMGMCLMAFGPHSGAVSMRKAKLPAGSYEVFINNESQGSIEVR